MSKCLLAASSLGSDGAMWKAVLEIVFLNDSDERQVRRGYPVPSPALSDEKP